MTDQAKPCPRCHKRKYVKPQRSAHDFRHYYACTVCNIAYPCRHDTLEQALSEWNGVTVPETDDIVGACLHAPILPIGWELGAGDTTVAYLIQTKRTADDVLVNFYKSHMEGRTKCPDMPWMEPDAQS